MTVDWGSPEVQRGLVTAAGVLLTALVTVGIWLANHLNERADAKAQRIEREGDLRLALWSDILPIWIGLYILGSDESKLAQVRAAFARAKDRGDACYTPFVFPAAEPLFAERLTEDVAMLAANEIEPVVRFYHQLARLRQMAAILREKEFGALPPDRKEAALILVTQLENQLELEARRALTALEQKLDLPDDMKIRAQIRRASVNRIRPQGARG